jgi:protein phosphatase
MLSFGVTDVGRRRAANQDSFIIDRLSPSTLLAVVCDGMGGAAGGLEASSIACSVFADSVEADLDRLDDRGRDVTPALCERILRRGVDFANAAVARRAAEDPGLAGMGTTLVAALVSGERIYVANVGDSRLYCVTDGVAEQVTHDHSYVQLLVDMGRMTEDQARKSPNKNIITRAVGTADEIECDVFTISTLPDAILLCSDGLTNMLSPDEIGAHFSPGLESEEDVSEVCRSLVEKANEKGGPDNITAVAVAFGVADEESEDEELLPIENGNLTSKLDVYSGDVQPDDASPDGTDEDGTAKSASDADGSDGPSENADAENKAEDEASLPAAPAENKEEGSAASSDGPEEASIGRTDEDGVPLGEDGPEDDGKGKKKKKSTGQLRLPGMSFIQKSRKKDKTKG